ncbi:hypothetical protein IHD13_17420 [Halomonas sp. 328]|nr:hypothetical protein [Halomonas sp. 328]
MTRRVAIIGAAHRFPGTTPETFWQDLQGGKDMVTRVAEERWSQEAYQHPDRRHPGTSVTFAAGSLGDVSGFDAAFFGISPREAANQGPHPGPPPGVARGAQGGGRGPPPPAGGGPPPGPPLPPPPRSSSPGRRAPPPPAKSTAPGPGRGRFRWWRRSRRALPRPAPLQRL